jgi:hypothetical protein
MLSAGGAIETELPIATIYEMRSSGNYNLRVSCKLPEGAALRSNELSVRV